MRYFEAFGEGGFHSAFMTTYAFGSLAFEDIPFPKLRGAGCRNITVLADRGMLNQAFSEFGPPRFAGTSYHLIKVDAPGAFHPKITVLLGENKGRLIVGSANLTALGLGGNKEQVASISYGQDTPDNAKFFIGALDYLRRYVPQDDPWFPISLQRAKRSTPWLRDDGYDPAFPMDGNTELSLLFDRPEINLLDQIIASIGTDPIERLVIVSPYWDSRLEGVARLKAGLGNPVTDILIENDANGFPASELPRFSDVSLFDISPSAEGRFLHSKLIIAHGEHWDHVISGSMNCTFPALMGPAANGNAEAGIYKRVARGSALEALGLDDYQDARLQSEQLIELQQLFEEADAVKRAVDGGALILQSMKISWTAQPKMLAVPASLQLYDRDGLALAVIELNGQHAATYSVSPDDQRPKHGILKFADGSVSAPVQILDLDTLAMRTLPSQGGRTKRLMDDLVDAMDEDIELMRIYKELEDLEDADRAARPMQAPKTKSETNEGVVRGYEVLPYEDFIRTRTQANAEGKSFGLYMNSRHDSAANLMSLCLNRMIGLVGIDLTGIEEKDFQAISVIDFRTTEPQSAEENVGKEGRGNSSPQNRSNSAQSLATAKKFQEAVAAFEARCKALVNKSITTSEMVRLRALMQIILSHAQPVSGSIVSSQILPVYNVEGYDWPRLIGRLLMQHFGATRALQNLAVEQDESEQQRVLEYLALSNWAAKAAHRAVMAHKKAAALRAPLERLIAALTTQTQTILSVFEGDKEYFDQISTKLDERFAKRLGF